MSFRAHPAAELFPLLDGTEFAALVEDIRAHGLRSPIVMLDMLVLDGRNRLRACDAAGVPARFEAFTGTDPVAYVISTNLHRRHLDESQRAMVAGKLADMRQGERTDLAQIPARSQGDAAKLLNVSRASVQSAAKVLDQGAPELAAAVEQGRVAVSTAAMIADAPKAEQVEIVARGEKEIVAAAKEIQRAKFEEKQAKKRAVAAQINAEPAPLPTGPFRVIVADPPWRYEKRTEDATHRAILPYPDMSTPEICALPVGALAHDDCILWLWTTNAFMRDAFAVLDAWGFQEKTILTWAKKQMSTGDWLRGRSEHCILAVRGRPVVLLTNQTTILEAPRREHSRKPDEFYELVEALCPGSKVEMFCREPRPGWAAWGAEADKFGKAS